MTAESRQEFSTITALVAGPLALLTNLLTSFVLAPWVCANHWQPALHTVHFVFLLVALAALWMAWKNWAATGREWPGEAPSRPAASRFIATMGVFVAALSALQIVGMIIVTLVLGVCQ